MKHSLLVIISIIFLGEIIGYRSIAQTTIPVDKPFLDAGDKKNTSEFPNKISSEDKLYTLSTIWNEIKYNFVNIDHIKFDPDSLYKVTIPKVIASHNDITYYDVLNRFICSFGDGHTQLLNTSYSWNEYFDYIPCLIKKFKDEYYFASIRKHSGIDSTLLGAKIIEIEGVPVKKYIEENYFPTIAASTLQHKMFQATQKIGQGIKGSFFEGKAIKRNGTIANFSINVMERQQEPIVTNPGSYKNKIKDRQLVWNGKTTLLSSRLTHSLIG